MISEKYSKMFCKEDISLIENYKIAINDKTEIWECHHRNEIRILPSGMIAIHSKQELIENGRYYNCPANELIFLSKKEHRALHGKYRKLSSETKNKISQKLIGHKLSKKSRTKISNANKGNKNNFLKFYSEFGKAYYEHYHISSTDNVKQYVREHAWYRKHGKCRWES